MNRSEIGARAQQIFRETLLESHVNTDKVFFWLLLIQWVIAVTVALTISPYAWAGKSRAIHMHVEIALFGGAVLNVLPLTLMALRPGSSLTRHVVAMTQMLWAAVFVHLTGGRIETHFHIFGSLAFLAFYRDPRLLITATLVVAVDHLLLGFFWPESVYGVANPEWWRFLEHAAWVAFEDVVLWLGCQQTLKEMRIASDREAKLEIAMRDVEVQVTYRTAELKAVADRHRTLIENTSAVPWEVNRETCDIIYLAPQMANLLGISSAPGALAGNLLAFFHPDDREPLRQFIAKPHGDSSRTYLDARLAKEGDVVHVRSFVAERLDPAATNSVCGISLDITQQKAMERDLMQAQKLESIGQLAAGIAHEINTPTQFIGDNIRFLRDSIVEVFAMVKALSPLTRREEGSPVSPGELDAILAAADIDYLQEEVPKAISQSLDGVDRIATIVGAMKEFSHPAIAHTPHDINRAIAGTIIVASNEWKYVADVATDFDPALPPVSVMPGAFNQVILNMIVNAAHAIGTGADPSARGTITVSTRKIGDSCEIRIRDTGCGIPIAIRERIFDQFFTTKPVGKGTGQGLAMAHDIIVNKHRGTISIESEEGQGTTFIIHLPIENRAPDSAVLAA